MTDRELKARLLEEKLQRLACRFRFYFPDTGPLRRELYSSKAQKDAIYRLREGQ